MQYTYGDSLLDFKNKFCGMPFLGHLWQEIKLSICELTIIYTLKTWLWGHVCNYL
jgi:hypothetical protein